MKVEELITKLQACTDQQREVYIDLPAEGARLVLIEGVDLNFPNYNLETNTTAAGELPLVVNLICF
jgi:hypothetical protein